MYYTLRGTIIKLENVTSFLEIACIVVEEYSGLLNVAASWDMIADSLSLNEIVCTEIKTHQDQGIAFCIYNSSSFIMAILRG